MRTRPLGQRELVICRRAGALLLPWLLLLLVSGRALLAVPEPPPIPPAIVPPGVLQTNTPEGPAELARYIVGRLQKLDLSKAPLTVDQGAWLKRECRKLGELGTNALPAITGFLSLNQDIYFDAPGSAELAGAPSLRAALVEVVGNMGDSSATELLLRLLKTSADPVELATLARSLESAAPGKHHPEFAAAAGDTLALAASGRWDDRDVAPLFEILLKFPTPTTSRDFELYAVRWFDYAAISLRWLPNNAGVPALIELARNADNKLVPGQEVYLRMLAELAIASPEAAQELKAQLKAGKVAPSIWSGIGVALAGSTLHLDSHILAPPPTLLARSSTQKHHIMLGNQTFLEASPSDQPAKADVGARIRLIDNLLENLSDPAGVDALEGARIKLSEQLAALDKKVGPGE